MRLLLANLHATSDPERVADWFLDTVDEYNIKVACLQEATRAHLGALSWTTGIGLGQVSVATPKPRQRAYVRMGNKTWFGWRSGRQHPSRWMALIRAPYPIGSTHAPPGVDATPKGLRGKADRTIAWVSFVRAFRRWAKRNPGPFIVAADWNDQPWRRGPFSIKWLARKTGAKIVGHGIDFLLVRGAEAHHVACIPAGPGMDHDAHVFEIGKRN